MNKCNDGDAARLDSGFSVARRHHTHFNGFRSLSPPRLAPFTRRLLGFCTRGKIMPQSSSVKQLQNPETVFETIIRLVVRLAEHGLIHCDFNEFNIMIDDDDEKVTMIDFPQMVSVSHRNAQMYFDRDVECIFKFFRKRFNLSFEEHNDRNDCSEADEDEQGRPSFSSIAKTAGFLAKELAASGFTRKDQDHIEQFIEGEMEKNTGSDTEGTNEEQVPESNEPSISEDSLHFIEQEKDNEDLDENDAELKKRLSKQRKHALAAARRGQNGHRSRNSYKDKGGKSSHNSKLHKQLTGW